MSLIRRAGWAVAVVAVLAVSARAASAQAVITNGAGVALGIDRLGQLNPEGLTLPGGALPNNAGVVGLSFFTTYAAGPASWGDATSPGCLCEGYGVSANGISGYADNSTGIVNITGDSFASTASTAK